MRCLLSLQLVQSAARDLASLHCGFAVFAKILSGRDIVVQAKAHFRSTRAHQGVREDPISQQKGGGMVGDRLARSGTEAEGGDE